MSRRREHTDEYTCIMQTNACMVVALLGLHNTKGGWTIFVILAVVLGRNSLSRGRLPVDDEQEYPHGLSDHLHIIIPSWKV